ncbi:hypothetical protein [Candidatus Protochlamydia phocaeensis]|uniref:hypothetical protein n=1 Tax=Candidatus Protochlamydia phocaeensis TaxID=1414722 RepID=UPI00083878C5|nr:hypothetical protein [Candidatus Protochlamydia phocaeensis]
MSKQDQNCSKEEEKKKNYEEPTGSHKEKAPENQLHAAGKGDRQGVKSGEIKHQEKDNKKKQPADSTQRDLDRNEGQMREQKP